MTMKYILSILLSLFFMPVYSQTVIPTPRNLPQEHPRLMTTDAEKSRIWHQIEK